MAKSRKGSRPKPTPNDEEPIIHEATLGPNCSVIKGDVISEREAARIRRRGGNIVVCGPDTVANSDLAKRIEASVHSTIRSCRPHSQAGPEALPHCHEWPRTTRGGHSFWETDKLKARDR